MASPTHQFIIEPIIPLEVGGLDLSFTNSALWMIIGVVISSTFLSLATSRTTLVPTRMQAFSEMLYEFVANMIRENIGTAGRQYFPLIFTLFIVILMGNVLGLIPYSFTYTSHIIVTAALAMLIFFAVLIFGIIKNGLSFFKLFAPTGLPVWLLPIIIPIELISFLVRPITLSVRLFANMMAGHLMLKVFAGFCVIFAGMGWSGFLMSTVPVLFNSLLLAFELLVALLHAYVFAVLSCIYLKDTVDLHH